MTRDSSSPARPDSRLSRRLIPLAVSAALLVALFFSVGTAGVGRVLAATNVWWFAAGAFLFLPQTYAIAKRWSIIASPVAKVPWREAGRQVLAAGCLNLVLPAKMGDLAKGVFLHREGKCTLGDGLQVVVFEKLLDLAALSAWMLVGWVFVRRTDVWLLAVLALGAAVVCGVWLLYFTKAGPGIAAAFVPAFARRGRLAKVARLVEEAPRVATLIRAQGGRRRVLGGWSLSIWMLHLLQIWCFLEAAGAPVGLLRTLAEMPAAIFAGLLPLTIAGIGLRDWAIVAIFASPTLPSEVLVAAGILISLRYVVPAAAGLLFAPAYYSMARRKKA